MIRDIQKIIGSGLSLASNAIALSTATSAPVRVPYDAIAYAALCDASLYYLFEADRTEFCCDRNGAFAWSVQMDLPA